MTEPFYAKRNQEEITTGNEPREPIFSDKKMKSYYDKQTQEMNTL